MDAFWRSGVGLPFGLKCNVVSGEEENGSQRMNGTTVRPFRSPRPVRKVRIGDGADVR